MKQITCLLQDSGFLFLLDPRTYGTSHKLITSSQQELSFQNRPVFYERNRIMKINFKIACSCQFYVEIDANEANVRYPLCSMERIGSLRNTFICQDTYQSPKLVLRTTLYKFGLISKSQVSQWCIAGYELKNETNYMPTSR